MQIFIYALVSSRDSLPRYVGQSWYVEGRRRSHFKGKGESPLRTWARQEKVAGYSIETRSLEECAGKDVADIREAWWIEALTSRGYELFNGTNGNTKITAALRERVLAENRALLARDEEWRRGLKP